jgi:hypothetical protein
MGVGPSRQEEKSIPHTTRSVFFRCINKSLTRCKKQEHHPQTDQIHQTRPEFIKLNPEIESDAYSEIFFSRVSDHAGGRKSEFGLKTPKSRVPGNSLAL